MNKPIKKYNSCRICNSDNINEVFKLKPTPPGDFFLPKDKLKLSIEKYPLIVALCEECGYLHLPYILDPEISYQNYLYETNISVGLKDNYRKYANDLIKFAALEKSNLVLDIGSNDGSMLEAFKSFGMSVVGVEPSKNISDLANKKSLTTINSFFNRDVSNEIIEKFGKPLIITSNNTYANIEDIIQFTENVKNLLHKDGIFVIQTGYHPEQMKINMFDYIYHEHFSYFSVKVLKGLLDRCGLELIHVEKHSIKGGSIRVISQHKGGKRNPKKSLNTILEEEHLNKIHNSDTYIEFSNNIKHRKNILLKFLNNILKKSKRIVGYGASHSTTTLLHHFEISKFIDYLVDDNPIKHGLFSPGYHLPVYPSEKLYKDKPEYVLVLGWQHQDSIINRNKKFSEDGGKFIIPLPECKILND
jgi:SAM-dependent methyltransferase